MNQNTINSNKMKHSYIEDTHFFHSLIAQMQSQTKSELFNKYPTRIVIFFADGSECNLLEICRESDHLQLFSK